MTTLTLTAHAPTARAVTKAHGKSFYLASLVLGAERKRESYALYAFLRRFDDVVDDPRASESRVRAHLDAGKALVRAMAAGARTAGIVDEHVLPASEAQAMSELVSRHGLPAQPLLDFFAGLEDDLAFSPPETDEDLDRYCYRVAGTVGYMMAWIFGVREPDALAAATTLGHAMQLTNIVRDVEDDLSRGRIYVPADALARRGLTPVFFAARPDDERVRALLASYAERARRLYEAAMPGIDAIGSFRARACVKVMTHVYAGILDELEAMRYAACGRATVGTSRRLLLALSALLTTSVWSSASKGGTP